MDNWMKLRVQITEVICKAYACLYYFYRLIKKKIFQT